MILSLVISVLVNDVSRETQGGSLSPLAFDLALIAMYTVRKPVALPAFGKLQLLYVSTIGTD